MKEPRKTYNRVFKEQAVQLSHERNNISELARELGITAVLLYKWRKD
ncbi:transposase, partial [Flavobacterium suncheonense]